MLRRSRLESLLRLSRTLRLFRWLWLLRVAEVGGAVENIAAVGCWLWVLEFGCWIVSLGCLGLG